MEFTLGGDPALPVRVLVSTLNPSYQEQSSDSSGEDEEVVSNDIVNWRKRFIELVFGPALSRLSAQSKSRLKGAGNVHCKKWHIHPSDWPKIAFHVSKIFAESGIFGECL